MVTDANQLLELLDARGIEPIDNTAIAQSLNNGHETCPLQISDDNSSNLTDSLISSLPTILQETTADLSESPSTPSTAGPAL